ncbi:tetrameric potassium-selective cyclic nucleotide gated channel-like [Thraustotheca clavata]|uniref:Tetrameric potassium-selective cyclic nucleotide gated channel-like n=1 Tax=Thraustotheca clavata TaxID=74557 RepID=A0A1W0A984_9STRA|nr:tetrameric potassium-selective cyclic nucleotide gated channel-like [Thraustotheca clavata]
MNGVNRHIGLGQKFKAANAQQLLNKNKNVAPSRVRKHSKKPLMALQQYETGYSIKQIDEGGAKPMRMKTLAHINDARKSRLSSSIMVLTAKMHDSRTYVINPRSTTSIQWDIFMAILIAYSGITVPLYVCFPGFQIASQWSKVDNVVDLCFGIDIVRNFLTGFHDEQDKLVVDHKQIAKLYLQTWFFLDFVSSFPFEAAVTLFNPQLITNSHSLSSIQLIRILRITRILKLARVAKLRLFFKRAEENFGLNPGVVRLTRLIFLVLFLAHVLACFFHLLGQPLDISTSSATSSRRLRIAESWQLTTYSSNSTWLIDNDLRSQSDGLRYLYSLYWVITTLTGVGYGDIHAVSVSERVFAIFAMMIGASVFGFVIGNISSLLDSMDTRAAVYQLKMMALKEYIRTHKLPKELRIRLSKYFEHYLARASLFDESSILGELPLSLRNEIVHYTCRDIFLIPAFASINSQFVMDMAICIKPLFLLSQSIVAKEGTVGREMFFLNSGIVAAYNSSIEGKKILLEVMSENAYFGESPLLFYTLRENTFVCWTNCEMYTLSKDDFDNLLEEYPDTEAILANYYHARRRQHTETHATMIERYKIYEECKDDMSKIHRLEDIWPHLRLTLNGKLTTIEQFPIQVLKHMNPYLAQRVSLFNSTFSKRVIMDGMKPRYAIAYASPETFYSIINPTNPFKLEWDIFLGALIVYNVMSIPFQFAFQGGYVGEDTRLPSFISLDYVVDVFFGIDMLITFRTAFIDEEGHIEYNATRITTRYLKWWFWIDFISTFPFGPIADTLAPSTSMVNGTLTTTSTSQSYQNLKLIRFLRLTRLLKLMRLLKLNRTVNTVENVLDISPAAVSLLKLLVQVCCIAHWSACVFYFIGEVSETYYNDSWIGPILYYAPTFDKYVTSLYFCFTTMATVGYGDISPITPIEVAYVIFFMLLGASVFGYIIGSMSTLVDQLQTKRSVMKEKMDRVKDYMKERNLPKPLCARIRRYFDFYLVQKEQATEDTFLEDLSDDLRTQLVLHLHRDVVNKIPFFARQDDACISYLMTVLYQECCTPGEFIFHEGEFGRHMYFLVKGTVEVLICANTPKELLCKVLTEGAFFGELAMLLNSKRCASVRAKSFGILYVLSRNGLDHIHAHYPEISNRIMQEIKLKLHKIQQETEERMQRKHISNHLPQAQATTELELLEAFKMIDEVARDLTVHFGGEEKSKHRAVATIINRLKKFDFDAHDVNDSTNPKTTTRVAPRQQFVRIGKQVMHMNAFMIHMQQTRRTSTEGKWTSLSLKCGDDTGKLSSVENLYATIEELMKPPQHSQQLQSPGPSIADLDKTCKSEPPSN